MIVGRSEQGTDCTRAIDAARRLIEEFREAPNSEDFLRTDLDLVRDFSVEVTSTIVAERSAVGRRGV